ncbi:MAG: RlmF-related methyltransferase, partial [Pseudomonadaceae bacterium]
GGNVAPLQARLRRLGAREVRTLDMAQGQKRSRFLAWTFLDVDQRAQWRARRGLQQQV